MEELFTSDQNTNWLHEKYYAAGANHRYFTFQLVLNLLTQYRKFQEDDDDLVIVETGCQRQEDDLGAGMSTSIFAEWASRHGGQVISVDNWEPHLLVCEQCIQPWKDRVRLVLCDSVSFLQGYRGPVDLLYLDSLDYPVGENAEDPVATFAAQQHCLNEFRAIEDRLSEHCVVMSDDNQLPGGGKPKLLKPYLAQRGYLCLLDFQQTVWVKKLK